LVSNSEASLMDWSLLTDWLRNIIMIRILNRNERVKGKGRKTE